MKKQLFALVMLAAGSALAADISIGIQIGAPPPPRVVVQPAMPGPGFIWIQGYWYPVEGHYRWHEGYWSRPPYEGAIWVGPHHDGARYFAGYWDGPHGHYEHDHRWDRDRDRDYHRDRREHDADDHDHGRGRGRGHDRD